MKKSLMIFLSTILALLCITACDSEAREKKITSVSLDLTHADLVMQRILVQDDFTTGAPTVNVTYNDNTSSTLLPSQFSVGGVKTGLQTATVTTYDNATAKYQLYVLDGYGESETLAQIDLELEMSIDRDLSEVVWVYEENSSPVQTLSFLPYSATSTDSAGVETPYTYTLISYPEGGSNHYIYIEELESQSIILENFAISGDTLSFTFTPPATEGASAQNCQLTSTSHTGMYGTWSGTFQGSRTEIVFDRRDDSYGTFILLQYDGENTPPSICRGAYELKSNTATLSFDYICTPRAVTFTKTGETLVSITTDAFNLTESGYLSRTYNSKIHSSPSQPL